MEIKEKLKEIDKFFRKYETDKLDIKCMLTPGEDCINIHFCFYGVDEDIEKNTFDNIINKFKKENQKYNVTPQISDTRLDGAKVYFCMITLKGEEND